MTIKIHQLSEGRIMAATKRKRAFDLFQALARIDDERTLHDYVMEGLPFNALIDLERRFGMSRHQIGRQLRINPSTMSRRVKEKRLTIDESERVARLARLLYQATQLFEGDEPGAVRWLNSPARSFGGIIPLVQAESEPGARDVEDLIGRLEYGVFT